MAIRLLPGFGLVEETRAAQALIPGAGSFDDPGSGVAELFFSGPSTAEVGQPSADFAVSMTGTLTGSYVITFSDGGESGAFDPPTLTLTPSVTAATSKYTAASSGVKNISIDNNRDLVNPGAIDVTCTADPQGQITSVVASGQVVTVSGTFTENPVSASAMLYAADPANGAVTQGPKIVQLNPSTGTFSVDFDTVPGDYASQTVTLSNTAGDTLLTYSEFITIIGISGNPQAPGSAPPATIPGVPTNVVATAGNGTVSVTCTPPSDGGSPITSYQVIASTGQSASSATLPVSIQMPNNVPATFQMRAVNAIGPGNLSNASNQVTPMVPVVAPGAPIIGTAVAGNGYIDVFFAAPDSNGGSPITYYTATLSTGESATGATSPIRVAASNGVARTATVRATNIAGTGMPSSSSNSVTPSASISVPDAPSVLLTAGEKTITAIVTAPANNGGAEIVSYTVILSTGEELTQASNPFVFNNLTALERTATAYATNSVGDSDLSEVSNAVTPSDTPVIPIDLLADEATVIETVSQVGMLHIALAFVDAPAPRERTIVLGKGSRAITSG